MSNNPIIILSELGLPIVTAVAFILFVLSFSSFVKISTILSIVRAGFGVDNIPSVFITFLLSITLSFFLLYPQLQKSLSVVDGSIKGRTVISDKEKAEAIINSLEQWKEFVAKVAKEEEKVRFYQLAVKIDKISTESLTNQASNDLKNSWRILAPAFLVTELKAAFITGFSLFLPLLIIDLLTSTVLVAIGLEKANPYLVSLPIKLLLFVLANGWSLITSNIINSYL